MTAEKKKVYGNMRIMAIQGKDLFRAEAITALKNGKLNADKFDGIIDESLDTDKLCEVYKAHEAEIGYPYLADKKYCRALVNVSFDYAVKLFEQYGRRFMRVTVIPFVKRICETMPVCVRWAASLRFLTRAKEEGYYEMFLLELTTGMRRGEIIGLKWRDLNLQTGELRISRQVVKTGKSTEISAPKTKSSIRTILLPPDMVELLAELKKQTKGEWMFPSPVKEGEPRNPTAVYHRFQLILERSNCKKVRFHDLRHTFATMALENGMDIKTLSAMIGHISSETTLNIYSHITDTMQQQAAVRIDREIGGTNAEMPEPPPSEVSDEPTLENATETVFEPYKPKIRKSGTGCVTMINDHLYEGRFTPRVNGKRISKNVYAKTREECEEKLAELIKQMKKEIGELKMRENNE